MMKENSQNILDKALAICKQKLWVVVFFSLFINLLMFVAPLHMLQIYDRVLASKSQVTLLTLTLLAVGLLIIYGLLEGVRSRILVRTGLRFDELLNERVFRTIFRAAIFEKGKTSLNQALRDLEMLREFVSGGAMVALCDAPWVPIFLAVIFMLHPLLGVVSTVGAIIIFVLAVINELGTRSLLEKGALHNLQANNNVMLGLRNAEVVKAMGMITSIRKNWSLKHDDALVDLTKASDIAGSVVASSRFVRMALQVIILGVGAYLAVSDEISPGTMIGASIIMGRALAPVEMAVGQWKNVSMSRTALARLREMFNSVPDESELMALPAPTGAIRVESIVVAPPASSTVVLKNLSFNIERGQVVGVVGPSGSGKSSLARTLVGVWPIGSGAVRFDESNIEHWDPEELGPFIGYMPQDVELFDGSVAENIARFNKIEPDKVVAAAQRAGVHEVIVNLKNGYDTEIGAGGYSLSGGERQRIALARALYGDPKIIVLDEPNANLDSSGEAALASAIQLSKEAGCSVIVISHRPSILSTVDEILVLNAGSLVKYGPRDQVMAELGRPT